MKPHRGLKDLLREIDAAIQSESLSHASELCNRALSMSELCPDDSCNLKERLLDIAMKEAHYESASSLIEELRKTAIGNGNRALLGRCHLNAGTLHMRRGELVQSEEHYRAAAYIFRWEIADARWLTRCYNNLGILLKGRGDWASSLDFFSRALDACTGIDEREIICAVLLNRSILQRKMGLLCDASYGTDRGLKLAKDANLRLAECRCLLESATIQLLREETQSARSHLHTAVSIADSMGYGRELAIGYELTGDSDLADGDVARAIDWYEQALRLANRIAPQSDLSVEAKRRVASGKLCQGDVAPALMIISEAAEEARIVGDQWELGVTLRVLGEAYIADAKVGLGIERLKESICVLGELSQESYELALAVFSLGKALLLRRGAGDISASRDHFLRARQIFGCLGWPSRVAAVDRLLGGIEEAHGLFARDDGDSGLSRTDAVAGKHGLDTAQYGLITCDERIVADIARWSGTELRVLIEGETGVGKELVARILHALSRFRENSLVAVDCGALSETLADSELFGHAKGAFTGAIQGRTGLIEEAQGGTLLLDEVGELSEALQAKLLRVLEMGEVRRVGENKVRPVNVRLISATSKDLLRAVNEGRFRRDLYYRLKEVLMRIPPLRERRRDTDLLLSYFMKRQCNKYGKAVRLSDDAKRMLLEYVWPGNVRELKGVVEALVASSDDGTVVRASVVEGFLVGSGTRSGLRGRLEDVERAEIEKALAACDSNQSRAAKMLGINRKTLRRKIRLLNEQPK